MSPGWHHRERCTTLAPPGANSKKPEEERRPACWHSPIDNEDVLFMDFHPEGVEISKKCIIVIVDNEISLQYAKNQARSCKIEIQY